MIKRALIAVLLALAGCVSTQAPAPPPTAMAAIVIVGQVEEYSSKAVVNYYIFVSSNGSLIVMTPEEVAGSAYAQSAVTRGEVAGIITLMPIMTAHQTCTGTKK